MLVFGNIILLSFLEYDRREKGTEGDKRDEV